MSVDLELATMDQIAHELRRRFDRRWLILYPGQDDCILSLSMLSHEEENLILTEYVQAECDFSEEIADEDEP